MRILLVDDDTILMGKLAESLTRQRYAVDIAENGEMAQEFLSLFSYDILVLDMLLPDANGISLCQQCRQQGITTPILMLTAETSNTDKVKALDMGADDYVVKPFDFEELCARIRALLRRDSSQVNTFLSWGLLRVNPTTFEVFYGEQSLRLTPKEYALLELFLRHPDRVFSLDAIIENIWAFDDPPSGDAVRTHIKGLRQKLKRGGASKNFVETVYGVGYRLKPLQVDDAQPDGPSQPEQASLDLQASQLHSDKPPEPQPDFALAIAQAWQTHETTIQERLRVLETIASALPNETLSTELRQTGQAQAHKLAGSLGCFGFADGSRLARELEHLLRQNLGSDTQKSTRFCHLVEQLRQNLAAGTPEQEKTRAIALHPQLLVMTAEPSFSSQLAVTDYSIVTASCPTNAQIVLKEHSSRLDGVILCITPANYDESLALLDTIRHQFPSMSVLIVTDITNVNQRLMLVQRGGDRLLSSSVAPEQMGKTIGQMLETTQAAIKIVLVDDDDSVLSLAQKVLKPWGWHLTTVPNPAELWSTLATIQPHLLVLDVEMPGTNGLDLCQVLRADEQWRQLPVIFLTAHEDISTKRHAFDVGGDDFVSKSTLTVDLPHRIRNRLRRSHLYLA